MGSWAVCSVPLASRGVVFSCPVITRLIKARLAPISGQALSGAGITSPAEAIIAAVKEGLHAAFGVRAAVLATSPRAIKAYANDASEDGSAHPALSGAASDGVFRRVGVRALSSGS